MSKPTKKQGNSGSQIQTKLQSLWPKTTHAKPVPKVNLSCSSKNYPSDSAPVPPATATPVPPAETRPVKYILKSSRSPNPGVSSDVDSSCQASTTPPAVFNQQCAGYTAAGNRCKNKKKWPLEEADRPYFCHHHIKQVMQQEESFNEEKDEWIKFSEYIKPYLSTSAQAALRHEMTKELSKADEPGYIYALEVRESNGSDVIEFKVGRTIKLNKRVDEWERQCPSKHLALRGWYPSPTGNNHMYLKGCVNPGENIPSCHRLERLIHIELEDLVKSGIYLKPNWPDIEVTDITVSEQLANVKRTSGPKRVPCPSCGKRHREIFSFEKYKGERKGKEYKMIVQPVIERWGDFVRRIYPPRLTDFKNCVDKSE